MQEQTMTPAQALEIVAAEFGGQTRQMPQYEDPNSERARHKAALAQLDSACKDRQLPPQFIHALHPLVWQGAHFLLVDMESHPPQQAHQHGVLIAALLKQICQQLDIVSRLQQLDTKPAPPDADTANHSRPAHAPSPVVGAPAPAPAPQASTAV